MACQGHLWSAATLNLSSLLDSLSRSVKVINALSRSFMVSHNVEFVFLAGQLVKVSQGHKWLVKVIYSKNVLCILHHTWVTFQNVSSVTSLVRALSHHWVRWGWGNFQRLWICGHLMCFTNTVLLLLLVVIARDSFARTNRRAIAMIFIRPSVCLGWQCIVIICYTLPQI